MAAGLNRGGAALLALVAAAPAAAQAADADVRCLLAANVFARAEKDPVKKELAVATGLFFSGRADARLSPAQLKAAIQSQGKALTTETVAQVMTACAKGFQDKQRGLQAIGRQIAAARPPPAASASPR